MRKLTWSLIVFCVCLPASGATMFISDELQVPLRSGPSTGNRIIHGGLPSGMALEVLSENKEAGYTQVRTPNGTEGWVPTQYLTGQPIARDRLAQANRRVQTLEAELKGLRESVQEVRGARTQAEGRTADLNKQTEKLQAELAEIRRVSATSVAQYEENKELKNRNQDLTTQVTQLTEQVHQLQRNAMLRWFLAGGGLVLVGLALGVWIKARPKRSSWK